MPKQLIFRIAHQQTQKLQTYVYDVRVAQSDAIQIARITRKSQSVWQNVSSITYTRKKNTNTQVWITEKKPNKPTIIYIYIEANRPKLRLLCDRVAMAKMWKNKYTFIYQARRTLKRSVKDDDGVVWSRFFVCVCVSLFNYPRKFALSVWMTCVWCSFT